EGFLRGLRALCSERDALLIVDEIYTGFGRTGTFFACDREGVRPDILCVGKALGGGFPISAAIARGEVADSWEPSQGEALHTSTYLGNPMGCAAALANLDEMERLSLAARAKENEAVIGERLHAIERYSSDIADIRGRGMLWAIEFKTPAWANACVISALRSGVILLQSGLRGECVTLAPPLVISPEQLRRALDLLTESLTRDRAYAF
ncbi:MAG TPA: aminotransferase class III-fold pyridoxal phosphate-dependent enzyme, partial [Candidatus Baltobacteraceae bacterium]|nr:aminotransferase class III-fold pyridoxal phosphate-dependent enzyme [Candidatus Baltobacteraceae bacterium]